MNKAFTCPQAAENLSFALNVMSNHPDIPVTTLGTEVPVVGHHDEVGTTATVYLPGYSEGDREFARGRVDEIISVFGSYAVSGGMSSHMPYVASTNVEIGPRQMSFQVQALPEARPSRSTGNSAPINNEIIPAMHGLMSLLGSLPGHVASVRISPRVADGKPHAIFHLDQPTPEKIAALHEGLLVTVEQEPSPGLADVIIGMLPDRSASVTAVMQKQSGLSSRLRSRPYSRRAV